MNAAPTPRSDAAYPFGVHCHLMLPHKTAAMIDN
jgi:hypothetical protein